MARRRPSAPSFAPITWRDGVHLTATPIWCDARRRRDICFVSSADRIGKAGHGQLIGTPATLALLGAESGGHLAVPPHRPFTLGTLRLELVPSGRGVGSAALHVDLGERAVLYAGAIRTINKTEAAGVRSCDAAVVAAPLGLPEHRLEPVEAVAARVIAHVKAELAAGRHAVLVVDTVLDAFELASELAAHDIAIAGSRGVRDAALRVGRFAQVPPIRAPGKEPTAVIRCDGERVKLALASTALVSPRALDQPKGYTAAFAWPFVADRAQLLTWIEQTRAKDVFITGAYAEPIATALGARARVLGPPHQMALFAP